MYFEVDTHTHTIASGHAYNTIMEMASAAKEKGLKLLCITEHGIAMPDTCHKFYFENLRVVPRNIKGMELLLGTEANVIDYTGQLDMDDSLLKQMDIVIASLHMFCLKPGTVEENTNALIGAMKNPYVNIIGHPDDGRYPVDYESLVKAAKEHHVLLELNNNSLNPSGFRPNTRPNDITMLTLCKEYQVPISLGSDAHVFSDIANYKYAFEIIKEVDFPEELIANTSTEKFLALLSQKQDNL